VGGAEVVLLALPLSEQRETLSAIAPELKSGCVVVSVAPLLGPSLAWADELLAAERHFVASHPILNPARWLTQTTGPEAARADLFARGQWALAPSPDCPPEALRLASDLITLLGASPYYVDPVEHDGVMGTVGALPTLLAWALMQAATSAPGWSEIRKAAGAGFAAATAALAEDDHTLLLLNHENVLRSLDATVEELKTLRDLVASGSGPRLQEALAEAASRRATWLAERQSGEPTDFPASSVELPSSSETFGRLLFGNLFGKRGEKKER
jgi:prephenate dehydrogenase